MNYNFEPLKKVNFIKFLGVFIEETLNWSKHINEVSKQISKINGVLYNLRRSIPRTLITSIYYALVNSKLSYCISAWGSGGAECSLAKLFTAQKRAVRTLYNVKRCNKFVRGHTKKVFNDNGIMTVHNLYSQSVFFDTYKIIHNEAPEFLFNKLSFSNHNTSRLINSKVVYKTLKNNFYFTAPKIWNTFNSVVETGLNPKIKIKKYLLNLQKTGEPNTWLPYNLSLDNYVTAAKSAAYL